MLDANQRPDYTGRIVQIPKADKVYAAILSIAALLYLFSVLQVLGRRKCGYRHIGHTISELGETGAPDQRLVAYGLFLPIGLAMGLVAWMVAPASPATAALAAAIAIGYLGAAQFPCDPGSPISGSFRQAMHNLLGGVQYVGGALALMRLAEIDEIAFKAASFALFGTAILLTFLSSDGKGVRGLVQRVGEVVLFASLALAAWRLGVPF
ncbi:MAG: DUF998 domain-containing protein [Telluria sp.]|nr:DUF998 domain-containing protein [Telluria sp.]